MTVTNSQEWCIVFDYPYLHDWMVIDLRYDPAIALASGRSGSGNAAKINALTVAYAYFPTFDLPNVLGQIG